MNHTLVFSNYLRNFTVQLAYGHSNESEFCALHPQCARVHALNLQCAQAHALNPQCAQVHALNSQCAQVHEQISCTESAVCAGTRTESAVCAGTRTESAVCAGTRTESAVCVGTQANLWIEILAQYFGHLVLVRSRLIITVWSADNTELNNVFHADLYYAYL